jgi:hypothetical protein
MLQHSKLFERFPEARELLHIIRHEIQQAQRPANEIILDDEAVMKMLCISKRKLQYMKSEEQIPYHTLSPNSTRTYYLLSDVLKLLEDNRIESIATNIRIK